MKIKLTIDRFEGEKAVLKTDSGHNIAWPKNNLPDNCHEGSILFFNITTEEGFEEQKRNLAKSVLNEILNTNDN